MTAVIQRLAIATLVVCGCAKSESPFEPVDMNAADTVSETDHGQRDSGQDADTSDTSPDMEVEDTGIDAPDLGDGDTPPVRTVQSACPMTAVSGGTAWTGWANLQFPAVLNLEVGEVSEPLFGQTWMQGQTEQAGMAEGWEGQLVVGPLGANPETQPGCFRALDAEYNVDVDNNDEWWLRLQPERAGLWGMYFRYRPPGGAWRYGDLNGSDDGVSNDQAAILAVDDPAGPEEIRVVTLNLRCRVEDWNTRVDLVVRGLVAVDPHIVGFQEDCSLPGGPSQSSEIAARLADQLDRGYDVRRTVTHQAMHPEGTFDEGISLLSAFPIESDTAIDLPFANFPRRAIVADVRLGNGDTLRVINTHMEFGGLNDAVRDEEATAIVAEVQGATIVMGDLNTDDDNPAYATFDAALDDVWVEVGSGNGFTIPSSSPVRRIDYIWFSGLNPQSADVVREVENSVFLSDHLGVSAVFAR